MLASENKITETKVPLWRSLVMIVQLKVMLWTHIGPVCVSCVNAEGLCVASALCQTATVCEDFFVGLLLPKKVMFNVCHEQLYFIFFYPSILYYLELPFFSLNAVKECFLVISSKRSIALIVLCCFNFQCLAFSVWKLIILSLLYKTAWFLCFFLWLNIL